MRLAPACLTEIELVIEVIPKHWLEVSALMSAQELGQLGYRRRILQFAWFQTIYSGSRNTPLDVSGSSIDES